MTPSTAPYMPTSEEVAAQPKTVSWRISNGEIVTGRDEDGTLESRSHIYGVPVRFGIVEEYITKEGVSVPERFRLVVKNPEDGQISVHMRLDSTQARNLMGALTLWDGISAISLSANQAAKPNKYGKKATYVNVKQFEGPGKTVELRYDAGTADWSDLPMILTEELDGCPAWKNWVAGGDEASPYDALSDWLTGQGFESYRGQLGYQALLEKAAKKAVDEFTEADWAKAAGWMEAACKRNLIPDDLKAAVAPVADEDEYDPFADE